MRVSFNSCKLNINFTVIKQDKEKLKVYDIILSIEKRRGKSMDIKGFCEHISALAIKSILYEVAATPKPGLVDRNNSGAHSDMDFFTFLSSSSVLSPYFYNCTYEGIVFKGDDYRDLLLKIRPFGIKAERDMFKATNGVNTHKGIIFSLGIIGASLGSLYAEGKILILENIIDRIKMITKGITDELKQTEDRLKPTYGEILFTKYGVRGIRGEVEEGFPTVLSYSYSIFKKLIEAGDHNINDVLVQTLLHLIATTEDSNILGRCDAETLKFTQDKAKKSIDLGGIFTKDGRAFIEKMDEEFIKQNISPGGSADLLAVTMMLYMIENGDII